MKKLVLVALFSTFTYSTFAEGVYPLGKEANDAIYHLSLCASDVSRIVIPGPWIGNSERWDSRTKNYGYNFSVFERDGFTSVKKIGVISLVATYIANPPLDRPSYKFNCTINFESTL